MFVQSVPDFQAERRKFLSAIAADAVPYLFTLDDSVDGQEHLMK